MIPKYYFLRMIFEDEELCADIRPQPPLSPMQCYQKRRLLIQQKMDEAIAAFPELPGGDILEVIRQREEILRRLDRHGALWLSQGEKQPFRQLLQRILRVTPAMIAGYSAALEQLLLEQDVTILLDEGKMPLRIQGRDYIAKTILEGELSREKCRDILGKLADYGCFPRKLTFYLPEGKVWDYLVEEDLLQPREDAQLSRAITQLR